VLENACDEKIETIARKQVFEPLGLESAGFENAYPPEIMAQGYSSTKPTPRWQFDALGAAGGIDMNIKDLTKYVTALMNPSSPIYEAGKKIMQPQVEQGNSFMGYSWFGVKSGNGNVLFHSGATGGYRAIVGMQPDTRNGIALMVNDGHSLDPIMAYYFGLAPKLPSIIETITMTDDELKEYVGKYNLMPNFDIVITREGNQLMAQATGQGAAPIFPEAKDKFFYKIVDAQIEFERNEQGELTGFTLYQNGQEIKGKKVE
jgi:CubicO group peptidase (beta-lactamase class C family)